MTTFLKNTVYFQPVGLFFYAWRFLKTLEREERNKTLKSAYKYFGYVSVVFFPLAFYSIYAAYVVETSAWLACEIDPKCVLNNSNSYEFWASVKLRSTFGYLTLCCNACCCIILLLVIRLVRKLTQ